MPENLELVHRATAKLFCEESATGCVSPRFFDFVSPNASKIQFQYSVWKTCKSLCDRTPAYILVLFSPRLTHKKRVFCMFVCLFSGSSLVWNRENKGRVNRCLCCIWSLRPVILPVGWVILF